jgi:hypothetical protein
VTTKKDKVENQTSELTEEQKQKNLEWWTQGFDKKISLSKGIKSVFENTPIPERITISDHQMAVAVFRTGTGCKFVPHDEESSSYLYSDGYINHGPFSLALRLGDYKEGRFLPDWMIFATGCYVSSSNYNEELVHEVVSVLKVSYEDPLKEPVAILPIPPWIKTDTIYYCLESEYQQMVEELIRSLVEIKIKNFQPSEE